MIRRVNNTSLTHLEKSGSSKIVATLTEDVSTAVRFFHALPEMFVNIAIVLCGFTYMALLSWQLLVVVAACLTFTGVTIGFLVKSTQQDRDAIRELTDGLIKNYQDLVQGAKELHLNQSRKRFFSAKLFTLVSEASFKTRRVLNILALMETWGQLAIFSTLGIVIYLVRIHVNVDAEIIIGYVITLLFLLEPIEIIINCSDELVQAKVAFNKIDRLKLAEEVDSPDDADIASTPFEASGSIELSGITWEYEPEDSTAFRLGPINVTFESGKVYMIRGGNGSGKSTLIKILCGLYEPDGGVVKYRNTVINEQNIVLYRSLFSVVMLDFCLFDDVLDSNGKFMDDASISHFLNRFKLSEVVSSDSGVLSNLALSQGQRKRLAFIQAYFESRPVIVLDEWAADQDPTFKHYFYNELVPALKAQGKTVILVSHDEQYFSHCDVALQLIEGKLSLLEKRRAN